jgi:hypothetical protein
MFARLERGQRDGRVGVVRGGDHHRLDLGLLFQHLAEIPPAFGLREPAEGSRRERVIDIAEGDDLLVGHVAEVGTAHAADADAGDAELAGGRRGLRPPGGGAERGGQAGFEKGAAGMVVFDHHGHGIMAGGYFGPTIPWPGAMVISAGSILAAATFLPSASPAILLPLTFTFLQASKVNIALRPCHG